MKLSTAQQILKGVLTYNKPLAIMLWGAPGLGKTEIVGQTAKELGWNLVDYRLSQKNPVDLIGVPYINKETGRTLFAPPNDFPYEDRDGKHGIFFLDELANANRENQNAVLSLVHERKAGEYRLPEHWRVVAAGNRMIDRAGSFQMTSSLANRFIHLPVCTDMPALEMGKGDVDTDIDEWKVWAYANEVREEVIAFLTQRPNLLWSPSNQVAYATPRMWETVSKMVDIFGLKGEVAQQAIAGCVGTGIASEFIGFCRVVNDLPDIDKILSDSNYQYSIPQDRPDISYAVCTSIAYRLGKMKKSKAKLEKAIDNTFSFLEKISSEFQMLLVSDIGKQGIIEDVAKRPGFATWAVQYREVFAHNA